MFKIILKNLWHRRRQNAWIFAELIIVTILSWIILDKVIVSLHDTNAPLGYDAGRIVNINIEVLRGDAKDFDASYYIPEAAEKAHDDLLSKARNLPDVESVISEYYGINGQGSMSTPMFTGNLATDSIAPFVFGMRINPDSKFLSTYGIETTDDSPTAEMLESHPLGENDIIITESIDRYYWPDRRGIKDKSFIKNPRDTTRLNVVGIIKDFRYRSFLRTPGVFISGTMPTPSRYFNRTTLILRLADGVDADAYCRENRDRISNDLRIGNYYVRSITSQKQQIKDVEYSHGVTNQRNLMLFVALLFLVNLIVGVTGCVWLQTGKRVSELGVLRSFGARRSQMVRMLIGESIVLATIAYTIGILIYLQYAISNGLADGYVENYRYLSDNSWVNNFNEHFAVVSSVVYVIIIACVAIGTYFPAHHVSRIEPVDALRDE